jgi:catechol 2,3-dioxygenase-like lactoylglutathione lyase family enzyme
MSSTQTSNDHATQIPSAGNVDLKLEAVIIPVADVDRAKRFYGSLGWRLDADFAFDNGFRVVQFTPPGSECSVQFGTKITSAAPGSAQDLYLIVSDIAAARDELVARGVKASEVFHPGTPGAQFQPNDTSGRVSGPAPDRASYRSFATFSDPDGNGWLLQEIKARLPGRGLGRDVATLTELLREAEKRHGDYEPTAPKHHWSGWYAAYIVAREQGRTSDEAAKDAAIHMEGARQ